MSAIRLDNTRVVTRSIIATGVVIRLRLIVGDVDARWAILDACSSNVFVREPHVCDTRRFVSIFPNTRDFCDCGPNRNVFFRLETCMVVGEFDSIVDRHTNTHIARLMLKGQLIDAVVLSKLIVYIPEV